jgi:ribonuclease P protein component
MNPIGRIRRSEDFERVLRTPMRSRTAHFALHHLGVRPSAPAPRQPAPELSTDASGVGARSMDDLVATASTATRPDMLWWGAVVPKRHARRSVTRSLLKRQIRACVASGSAGLLAGLWVVRLRAPFDRVAFPSAASDALRLAARDELQALLARAARA